MLSVDGKGLPLGGILDSAQKAEIELALKTIKQIHGKTPEKLCADKAYDSKKFRKDLNKLKIKSFIPKRRKAGQAKEPKYNNFLKPVYKTRWIIERSIAWLGWKRRLLIRWERKPIVFQAFFNIACLLICMKEVLK